MIYKVLIIVRIELLDYIYGRWSDVLFFVIVMMDGRFMILLVMYYFISLLILCI